METVGRLARRFGLSRSTLLYYDRIGLLCPSGRSASGYRLYDTIDVRRLEKIIAFRGVGLSLESIGPLLSESDPSMSTGSVNAVLEKRLVTIDREITGLRRQQEVILRLLQRSGPEHRKGGLDKEGWTEILRAAGMDDEDMWRWHREFERMAPTAHQEFLESLQIESDEIDTIRAQSRSSA
ncbi:MAG: MerR family transcriptional regulator [Thermoanaerobaculia bacterium]|nr:MerR family transcriptional regulator [Thermoanaerobaculia bacterium]